MARELDDPLETLADGLLVAHGAGGTVRREHR